MLTTEPITARQIAFIRELDKRIDPKGWTRKAASDWISSVTEEIPMTDEQFHKLDCAGVPLAELVSCMIDGRLEGMSMADASRRLATLRR